MTNSTSIYSRINTQEVFCDLEGKIIDFNNNIFNFKKGDNILESHPFFESIAAVIIDNQNTIDSFPCVHLDINQQDRICDVSFKKEAHQLTITLIDYTEPYKELNTIAQERNESIIAKQMLVLKNQQLEQQNRFKNKFLANISHEIRTPLTAIVGFSELLKKTNLNFEQLGLLDVITNASEQLTATINDMLDIAKIELGELKISNEEINLKEVILDIAKVYKEKAKSKGINFSVEYDEEILSNTIGDKLRIQQVLGNLLENAIKFTNVGNVSLVVKKSFQRANKIGVDFYVEDTGQGIPEDHLRSVFESFHQVNTSEKQKGTGLGLAITKTLVEALEGKIQVESELGKGSQFRMYLPFKLNLRTSPKTIGKSIETSVFKDNKKYNLLLVDNSEINQLLVVKSLLNHGGFYVDVAQDGEKALQYIQVRDYDIILMDLKMPNLDGFETTKAIRSLKDRDLKKIPIVALTAFASQDQKKACLKAGMNAYISKPFKQEELISVVEKIFLKANNK